MGGCGEVRGSSPSRSSCARGRFCGDSGVGVCFGCVACGSAGGFSAGGGKAERDSDLIKVDSIVVSVKIGCLFGAGSAGLVVGCWCGWWW